MFGRRRIDVSPQELQDYVTYQIGASARLPVPGAELTHVKPHGILYSMAGQDPAIGRALLTAVRDYDPNLVIVGGAETPAIAKELGVRVLPEAYCDLDYHPNGYPVVERQSAPGTRKRSPAVLCGSRWSNAVLPSMAPS